MCLMLYTRIVSDNSIGVSGMSTAIIKIAGIYMADQGKSMHNRNIIKITKEYKICTLEP